MIETVDWDGRKIAWATPENFDQITEVARNEGITGVGISPYKGHRAPDLSWVTKFNNLKALVIPVASSYDLSTLGPMPELDHLTIGEVRDSFAIEEFSCVRSLRLQVWKNIQLPKFPFLDDLVLADFSNDLGKLCDLIPVVRKLVLNSPKIRRIDSLTKLQNLSSLTIINARRFSVTKLAPPNLKFLNFKLCRSIKGFNEFCCPSIEELRFDDCGAIEAMKDVRDRHHNLRIVCLKTTI